MLNYISTYGFLSDAEPFSKQFRRRKFVTRKKGQPGIRAKWL